MNLQESIKKDLELFKECQITEAEQDFQQKYYTIEDVYKALDKNVHKIRDEQLAIIKGMEQNTEFTPHEEDWPLWENLQEQVMDYDPHSIRRYWLAMFGEGFDK